MLLDYLVKIPDDPRVKKSNSFRKDSRNGIYIYYRSKALINGEIGYENQLIGKQCKSNPNLMIPNDQFSRYFPDTHHYSIEYAEYLAEHQKNFKHAYRFLVDNDIYTRTCMSGLESIITTHDESRYSDDEYEAYDAYFVCVKSNTDIPEDVIKSFAYARLHHIHNNPHHCEYWLAYDLDKRQVLSLEMPPHYVVEYVCDWYAFLKTHSGTFDIQTWNDSSEKDLLHHNSRELAERLMKILNGDDIYDE